MLQLAQQWCGIVHWRTLQSTAFHITLLNIPIYFLELCGSSLVTCYRLEVLRPCPAPTSCWVFITSKRHIHVQACHLHSLPLQLHLQRAGIEAQVPSTSYTQPFWSFAPNAYYLTTRLWQVIFFTTGDNGWSEPNSGCTIATVIGFPRDPFTGNNQHSLLPLLRVHRLANVECSSRVGYSSLPSSAWS